MNGTPETMDEFLARIAAQLAAHFTKFAPVIRAINAGMTATANGARAAQEAE